MEAVISRDYAEMNPHPHLACHFPAELNHTLDLLTRRELIEPADEGYRFQLELIRHWFAQKISNEFRVQSFEFMVSRNEPETRNRKLETRNPKPELRRFPIMPRILYPSSVSISFVFLVANVLILLVILALNRRVGAKPSQADGLEWESKHLKASDILGWEFEYARTTASEAMQDRHTMINFYLLVAGVMASGVVAVLGQDTELPKAAGTVLLWLLCGIGWLYFLKIIRFRQAWHGSAQAMNRIKDFYIQNVKNFEPDVLREAFLWKTETLPPPDKPWTAYFYSAMLIGFLDSVAYVAGGMLTYQGATLAFPFSVVGPLALFGLAFFAFHVWLYFAFLKP